jgi:hypothetical protein
LKSGSALLRACAPEPVTRLKLDASARRAGVAPASRAGLWGAGGRARPEATGKPQEANPARPVRIDGTALGLSTDEWVGLAPRLRG